MLNYNVHVAIQLRSGQITETDYNGNPVTFDFRKSIAAAADQNYLWGVQYPGEYYYQFMGCKGGERKSKIGNGCTANSGNIFVTHKMIAMNLTFNWAKNEGLL